MEGIDVGVQIYRITISKLIYVDDTVLIAANQDDFQLLINKVTETSDKLAIKFNTAKTKFRVGSNKLIQELKIR